MFWATLEAVKAYEAISGVVKCNNAMLNAATARGEGLPSLRTSTIALIQQMRVLEATINMSDLSGAHFIS